MTKNKTVHIYTDGGSRSNPGPAGIGVVIKDEKGNILVEFQKYLGEATNNIAEYSAVIYGLQEALFLGAKNAILYLDSELVAKQLTGEYKVKDKDIKLFFQIAGHLQKGFAKFEIKQIPREENKEADKLVNKAINLSSLL